MEKDANVSGNHNILTSPEIADMGHRIVKHSDMFAVFNILGNIQKTGTSVQGLYFKGTRFLSRWTLTIDGLPLQLLSSDVTRDNHLVAVDLTNPDFRLDSGVSVPIGTLHVFRSKFLWKGQCHEKCRLKNFGLQPVAFRLKCIFEADFVDIFEIRGLKRRQRGRYQRPRISECTLEFSYKGRDGVSRQTSIDFSRPPDRIDLNEVEYDLSLDVGQEIELKVTVSCFDGPGKEKSAIISYEKAFSDSSNFLRIAGQRECSISTSNEHFNTLIERATSDLRMLLTDIDGILFPYAGIPWFATPFGRDALITGMETLWCNPDIGRDVLAYLAARQADALDDDQDAEPGKILHEIRMGEMTNCGELPFSRYYGSADATPLFVILAGKYFRRTGDQEFAAKLWPNVERALHWMDHHGDLDQDGFVEYCKRSGHGIDNQGWKDSQDAVFHADGRLAEAPIAACEIQGYVYAAKKEAAFLAENLGQREAAAALHSQARRLRRQFERTFWDPKLGFYVLALDRDKKPCRVKASNAGHCLFAGIVSADRAHKTAELLMSPGFYSGWGVRTLAQNQARYNPMSYHNGSIWPHDNAIIVEGFSRYGFNRYAATILDGLFHMSHFTELNRYPELFCGFERRDRQGPTLYPVACAPQAWAAASLFLLLKACLGLRVDAVAKRVIFKNPALPAWLENLSVTGLEINGKTVDFMVTRHPHDVSIQVFKRSGDIRFITEK